MKADIKNMKAEMQDMKTDIKNMKAEIRDMKADIKNMKVEIQGIKADFKDMKAETQSMKAEIQNMKADIQNMKADIKNMKSDILYLKQKVTGIELKLEREISCAIQLLAENHSTLINKLNQAVKSADKNLVWEVELSSFRMRLGKLEDEFAVWKSKMA